MAKFRLVHTSFWNDPRVVEEMTAEDKYFFLYLLTNESTTQIGIYQITKKQIAFDLGYSPENANALLQRFIDHHKLVKYNAETREIAIKNWGKYNLVRGGKPILDCVKSELKNVKDSTLIEWVGENVPNDSIRDVYESYYVTCYDTSTIRNDVESKEPQVNGGAPSYVTSTISGQEEDKEKEEDKEEDKEKEEEGEKDKERNLASPPLAPLSDASFIKIKSFFEQNIRLATFRDAQDINKLLEYYLDADLIIEAIKIALDRSKPYMNYIDGILKRWSTEQGINTYQDYLTKGGSSNETNQRQSSDARIHAEERLRQQAERLKGRI